MRRSLPFAPLVLLAALSCSSDSPAGPGGLRGLAGAADDDPWIAFASGAGIELVRPDGTGRHLVHAGGDRPSISPDGTKIAFEKFVPGAAIWEVFTMNLDGSNVVAISNSPHFDGYPAWSPDGTKIAFRRQENGNDTGHIWVMNADGSAQTQITFGPVDQNPDDFRPTWTPDGTRIVFESTLDGAPLRQVDLMSVSASGGVPFNLTNTPGVGETHPDVSPDGAWIVATCARGGATRHDVCRLPAGGGFTQNLRATAAFEYEPAWSPDGQRIVFSGGNSSGLWIMNADGSGAAPLGVGVGGADLEPDWGQPADDDPPPPPDDPECSDEDDNDEDGKVDHPTDPGCSGPNDDSESPDPTPPPPVPQCKDGIDNDGDGRTDHPSDPGCENRRDATEAPDPARDAACTKVVDDARARIEAMRLPAAIKAILIRGLSLLEARCA